MWTKWTDYGLPLNQCYMKDLCMFKTPRSLNHRLRYSILVITIYCNNILCKKAATINAFKCSFSSSRKSYNKVLSILRFLFRYFVLAFIEKADMLLKKCLLTTGINYDSLLRQRFIKMFFLLGLCTTELYGVE